MTTEGLGFYYYGKGECKGSWSSPPSMTKYRRPVDRALSPALSPPAEEEGILASVALP
jgi:hypothetical protein